MPGSFYVRAFIKQYADMVGLDGDELLIEYEDELSSNSDISNDSDDVEGDKIPSRAERYVTNENNSFDATSLEKEDTVKNEVENNDDNQEKTIEKEEKPAKKTRRPNRNTQKRTRRSVKKNVEE